jgi:hypothetical protein
MKTLIILFVLFWLTACFANAQDSLQVQPSPGLPAGQPANQPAQKEDRIEIKHQEVPAKLRNVLQADSKYQGWENGNLYFERTTDQYLLHLIKENSTQTYRFDKAGKPITTDKASEGSEFKN